MGTSEPSTASGADAPEQRKPAAEHVYLRVKDQNGAEVDFKIKKNATLKKLKDAFFLVGLIR